MRLSTSWSRWLSASPPFAAIEEDACSFISSTPRAIVSTTDKCRCCISSRQSVNLKFMTSKCIAQTWKKAHKQITSYLSVINYFIRYSVFNSFMARVGRLMPCLFTLLHPQSSFPTSTNFFQVQQWSRTPCIHERTCVRAANALTNWAGQSLFAWIVINWSTHANLFVMWVLIVA